MKPTAQPARKRLTRTLLTACLLLACAGSVAAQAPEAAADAAANQAAGQQAAGVDVPLRRVTLYSSGVGFFEHRGPAPDGGQLQLRFREAQINDILKSLQVYGADTATISFDTAEPLRDRLGKFGIDVSGDTSLPAILKQLRGEVITAHAPAPITGRILDVSSQTSVVAQGDGVIVPDHAITLVTEQGIQQVQLRQVQKLELSNKQLSDELNKALITLAGARNQDARPVDIRLGGEMDKNVSLRYLVEAPVWKTSYRLSLSDKGEAQLQGWAVVENTTDSDWDGVVLTLASGRPVSFIQDLYSPLRLRRPIYVPALFASLGPTTYDLGRGLVEEKLAEASRERSELRRADKEFADNFAKPNAPAADLAGGFGPGAAGEKDEQARQIAAAALAGSRGELFQYTVGQGVDLPRGRSAMLPILSQDVKVDRLSVFDMNTHATHPMRGVRLINGADLKLPAGPMTVLDDQAYAGDATLPFTGPDDKRLLTYAVDLEMQVSASASQESKLIKGIIAQGVLRLDYSADLTRTYAITNEASAERTLLIAHPITSGWTLSTPKEPAETTDSQYRFEVKAKADSDSTFKVVETRTYQQAYRLFDYDLNQIEVWSKNAALDAKLREALAKAAAIKAQEIQLRQQASDQREQTQAITREQGRIRDNMSRVDRNSQLYQRYVTKLTEQEDQLEELQAKAFELDAAANAKRDELAAYLNGLNID